MKKAVCSIMIIVMTIGLTGCGENPNTTGGTLIGAAAGGLIGSRFGRGGGQIAATIIGAAAGGYIGNRIGQYMDRQDQANYRSAVVNTPVGQQASWRNQKTDTTYTVRPVKQYRQGNRKCRRYRTTVDIKGKGPREAYGVACKDSNGRWKIKE